MEFNAQTKAAETLVNDQITKSLLSAWTSPNELNAQTKAAETLHITKRGLEAEREALANGQIIKIEKVMVDSFNHPAGTDYTALTSVNCPNDQQGNKAEYNVRGESKNGRLLCAWTLPAESGGYECYGLAFIITGGILWAYQEVDIGFKPAPSAGSFFEPKGIITRESSTAANITCDLHLDDGYATIDDANYLIQQERIRMLQLLRRMEGKLGKVQLYVNQNDVDEDYLPIIGQTISKSQYPDYFKYLGVTASTLTLPNWSTHGYIRQFSSTLEAGTQLADEIKSHYHNASSGAAGGHTPSINPISVGTKTLDAFNLDGTFRTSEHGAIKHSYSLSKGGSHTHTVTEATTGNHGHSASSGSGGVHDHGVTAGAVGNHTHSATVGDSGSHGHTASSSDAGNHGHAVSVDGGGTHGHNASSGAAGNHNHSGKADYNGNHSHTIGDANRNNGENGHAFDASSWDPVRYARTGTEGAHEHSLTINYNGNHSHSVSVQNGGYHSHNASITANGNHKHGVTVNVGGNHNHSAAIAAAGSHSHTMTCTDSTAHSHTVSITANGNHKHNVAVNATNSDHTHAISISDHAAHTHAVKVTFNVNGARVNIGTLQPTAKPVGNHQHSVSISAFGGAENRPRTTVAVYAVKVAYITELEVS